MGHTPKNKMEPETDGFVVQGSLLRFHVSFRGCMSGQFVLNHSEDSGRPLDPCPLPRRSTSIIYHHEKPNSMINKKLGCNNIFYHHELSVHLKYACMYKKTYLSINVPDFNWTKNITTSRASHPGDKSTGWQLDDNIPQTCSSLMVVIPSWRNFVRTWVC